MHHTHTPPFILLVHRDHEPKSLPPRLVRIIKDEVLGADRSSAAPHAEYEVDIAEVAIGLL